MGNKVVLDTRLFIGIKTWIGGLVPLHVKLENFDAFHILAYFTCLWSPDNSEAHLLLFGNYDGCKDAVDLPLV